MDKQVFNLKKRVDKVLRVMKNLKYYSKETLDYNIEAIDVMQILSKLAVNTDYKLNMIQKKAIDRFEKETVTIGSVLTAFYYSNAPTTLDIVDNPEQRVTQQQMRYIITSESNRDKDLITIGDLQVFPLSEEDLDTYTEVVKKLGYVVKENKAI